MSNLTNMFDSRFIPQMIENPMDNIIRQINEDTETYICNRLIALDIDKDILMNQTQEIQRLNEVIAEYERLEEQGLLLKLPCKIGDTVYVFEEEWEEIYNPDSRYYIICEEKFSIDMFEDIGKYVFLTREEAELELANIQQSHAEAIMDERNGR